ncbi:putative leader peptide [Oerskovia sp. KBS0722]
MGPCAVPAAAARIAAMHFDVSLHEHAGTPVRLVVRRAVDLRRVAGCLCR